MEMKVIKAEKDYLSFLHQAEHLVASDPVLGTKDAEKLELLALLIEDFEKRHFIFEVVDPIDAIEFRMNEQRLRQKDLIPLIGSRSRVSEVLARKRPLTVQMIRALSVGLGIPLEALVVEAGKHFAEVNVNSIDEIDWKKFPIKEMEKLGWFEAIKKDAFSSTEELVKAFLSQLKGKANIQALYRRTFRGEEIDERAHYSTLAWTARVMVRAKQSNLQKVKFDPANLTPDLFRELAQLSWFEDGPRLAVEFLAKYGVVLIIEPRLPNTRLDGAAILMEGNVPVIGLTLRFDRVDYFWFTLLHELAHVWKHLNSTDEAFVDRLENMDSVLPFEKEANRIARDALVPRAIWKRSKAFFSPNKQNIVELAHKLHVHPAIIAGRLQFETGKYSNFRELLGEGAVRKCFPGQMFS